MFIKLDVPQYSVKYFENRTITLIFKKIVYTRACKLFIQRITIKKAEKERDKKKDRL